MKNNKYTLYAYLFLLFIIVLSMFVSIVATTSISQNGSEYLRQASLIYYGDSPDLLWRGPFYSLLIAFSFVIGGHSLSSAHWMTELIFVFSILSFFLYTKIVYSKKTALISSLLICSSIEIFTIRRTIDSSYLLPGLIILSCYFIIKGYKNKSHLYLSLSGSILGLAILTKEIALFYFVFPIILSIVVKDFYKFVKFKGLMIYYFSCILVLLPWIYFLNSQGESLMTLLGGFNPSTGNINNLLGYESFTKFLIGMVGKGFIGLYNSLSGEIMITPLLLISFIIVSWRGFSIMKNVDDRIIIATISPFIPWTISYGIYQDGLRHIILFIIILFICFSNVLPIIIKNIVSSRIYITGLHTFRRTNLLFICFIIAIGIGLVVVKTSMYSVIAGKLHAKFNKIYFGTDFIPAGRFNKEIRDSADWINENVPKGSMIYPSGLYGYPTVFYTHNNFQYEYTRYSNDALNIPNYFNVYHHLMDNQSLLDTRTDENAMFINAYNSLLSKENKIVGITTTSKFRSSHVRYRQLIFVILESDLVEYINRIQTKKEWIIRTDDEKIIFPFVDNLISQHCKLVYNVNGIKIYETLPENTNISNLLNISKLHLSQWVTDDIRWLYNNYPSEYKKLSLFFNKNGINIEF